jgi:TnpA family transposase
MASIERTVYPRLKKRFSSLELRDYYSPTEDEIYFVKNHANGDEPQLHLSVLLKIFQTLGYFPNIEDVPPEIVNYLIGALGLNSKSLPLVSKNTVTRHQAAVRLFLKVKVFDRNGRKALTRAVLIASQTMDNPADLINVAVEELIKERFELPAFSTIDKRVQKLRSRVNRHLFTRLANRLSAIEIAALDNLLVSDQKTFRSSFNRLKELPKRPTLSHLQELLAHLDWIFSLGELMPKLDDVPKLKIQHFAAHAAALHAGELKDYADDKRRALILCLIYRAAVKTRDALCLMFLKRMAKFQTLAKEKLKNLQLKQHEKTELLLTLFGNVLKAVRESESNEQVGSNLKKILKPNNLDTLIDDCESIAALCNDNHFPFIWKFYSSHRKTLFRLLKSLNFISTSQDQTLISALKFLLENESRRSDYLEPVIDLSFAQEKWEKIVRLSAGGTPVYDRRHFEVCVFSALADELRSGDIAVQGSEEYADYRQQLLSWEECVPLIAGYCQAVELPNTAAGLVDLLRQLLEQTAVAVDTASMAETSFSFDEKGNLILKKVAKQEQPTNLKELENAIAEQMPERNLLDMLAFADHHTGFTRHFGHISGSEPKFADARARYLLTLFTYGCNLGPSQAARHLGGSVSRQMLGAVNQKHVTAKKLDSAREDVLNRYNHFSLPKFWGSGSHVSADGTKFDLSEQNLMAEYHIRYGGYGGIAYYHVSDMYIALFSHFIACGTWEAVYIIDGLLKNKSEIQPDVVHADTQGQSTPVFGLSYLLGIELQPRIRNIKDLIFFRPDKNTHYKYIDNLFQESVDWELIETHWQDLMQVVLSIKAGKILPSTLLRKLGNYSRKNRLYLAYRELGRVVRTVFLLKYISDPKLRAEIQAETNKVESFNGFIKWIHFGGEGTLRENDPEEQDKLMKYKLLVADAVIFQNVIDQTRIIQELLTEGYKVTAEDLKFLSPYLTAHIKRFGEYVLDLSEIPPPLDIEYTFRL